MTPYDEYQKLLRERLERIQKRRAEYVALQQLPPSIRTSARHSQAYLERIASAEWRELKDRLTRERGGKCERCGRPDVVLELHHKHYHSIGRERDEDLSLLCGLCHQTADAERVEATRFSRGRDTYATKKYGDDSRFWPDNIDEEFDSWRERKREEW